MLTSHNAQVGKLLPATNENGLLGDWQATRLTKRDPPRSSTYQINQPVTFCYGVDVS